VLAKKSGRCYERADPSGQRLEFANLSYKEQCISVELRTRDLSQRTPFPLKLANSSRDLRNIQNDVKFYCYCCKEVVGLHHFPLREMLASIHDRTGMSEIFERKCFTQAMPVHLWKDSVVTWERLQEERKELRRPGRHRQIRVLDWKCYPDCHTAEELCTHKSKSRPSSLDTLTLHRVFPDRVEARAEYFINLYEPLRFRTASVATAIELVKEQRPCI
jgi:hypothetical protein